MEIIPYILLNALADACGNDEDNKGLEPQAKYSPISFPIHGISTRQNV